MVSTKTDTLSTMVDYWTRLKEAMTHAGVVKAQLQTHLGVSYQAMKKLEDGKTKSLTAENNAKAAKFLGVNAYWLATGQETKEIPSSATPATTLNLQEKRAQNEAKVWPFEDIKPEQYQRLTPVQKSKVEGYILGMLENLETRAA